MKLLLTSATLLGSLYLLLCLLLYFVQESFIFFPQSLPQDYQFQFRGMFEERYIGAPDGKQLHGLLFRAENALGSASVKNGQEQQQLIFFLHGNAGALNDWGHMAETYTRLGYDVFVLDYRGYGKSEGKLQNQEQLFADVQAAYSQIVSDWGEHNTTIVGFSLGTGPAAMLAARNQPKKLILLAPYYSLRDMMQRSLPFVPAFLLKYPIRTHQFLEQVAAPVYLIHGTRDEVIPYDSSLKLGQHLKAGDRMIPIEGEYHNSLHASPEYQQLLPRLLTSDPTP